MKSGELRLHRKQEASLKNPVVDKAAVAAANLMVLLEDVVHLGHVLAADGFDDVALVIRRVEAGAAPSLGLAVQGGAACQGVLWTQSQRQRLKGVGARVSGGTMHVYGLHFIPHFQLEHERKRLSDETKCLL